jgi:hypothetical protein
VKGDVKMNKQCTQQKLEDNQMNCRHIISVFHDEDYETMDGPVWWECVCLECGETFWRRSDECQNVLRSNNVGNLAIVPAIRLMQKEYKKLAGAGLNPEEAYNRLKEILDKASA